MPVRSVHWVSEDLSGRELRERSALSTLHAEALGGVRGEETWLRDDSWGPQAEREVVPQRRRTSEQGGATETKGISRRRVWSEGSEPTGRSGQLRTGRRSLNLTIALSWSLGGSRDSACVCTHTYVKGQAAIT